MPEQDKELEWSAFRYVSGEMSAAELADFENLLESDLAAQEAVVSAMEIAEVIASSPVNATSTCRPVQSKGRTSFRRAATWIGLAACLGFVLLASRIAKEPTRVADSMDHENASLAMDWSELQSQSLEADDHGHWMELEAFAEEDSPAETEEPAVDEVEIHLPEWLLAATDLAAIQSDRSTGNIP